MTDDWSGHHAVVLGGAGFLGSHLCDALIARGCRVTVLDNLVTGAWSNLGHLNQNGSLRMVQHDVTSRPPEHLDADMVFHLASPATPDDYLQRPIETLAVGSWGTRNALDLAGASGARFLLASTSEVYGDPEVTPQPESYWGRVNPVGPRSSYDEAKRFAEALVFAYRTELGLDTRIARIFNTYGPRMRIGDGRVVPAFFEAAISGRPLPVHGDGTQTRSLCYVADLVEGLLLLMESDHPGPMNLGRPEEVTMLSLAEMVQDVVGNRPGVVFVDGREEDPVRRKPEITLARTALGWEPRTSLRAGLEACLPWFEEASFAENSFVDR